MADEIEIEEELDETGIASLREAANRSKANKAEADSAKRELAFVKAGIDTESKIGKMLLDTYDGELTKEALTEYISDIPGLAAPVVEDEEGELSEEELGSTRERDGLSGDSKPATNHGKPHPVEVARKVRDDAREEGVAEEEVLARQFNSIVGAAMEGDQRVIVRNPVGA